MSRLITPGMEVQKDRPTVAVISIAFSAALLRQVTEQVNSMPWSASYENFEEYFGPQSRPRWASSTKAASICIALVDFDVNTNAALDSVEFLLQSLPGKISIVALTSDPDPSIILRAMRAGCSEYLPKPLDNRSFTEALTRIERRFTSVNEAAVRLGTILSFVGAKGGVGTTTLAIHLATHLAVNHKKRTLLIDNDSGLGHVCLYLGLEGTHYSFRDLLRNVNRLDKDLLKGFVVRHVSGLDVIASAEMHGVSAHLDPDEVRRALNFIREQYDYVLVDCPASLDDATMSIVDLSEQVYLIATPDIGSIRDLSRLVDGLLRYHQPKEKLQVILNRVGSKGAMSSGQIEKASRHPVARNITNSYLEIAKAAAMGLPVPPEEKSEFASQLREWSESIAGDPVQDVAAAPVKKRSPFWKSN